jgi:DtxR family Mn-dependent transcriptional regulator
MQVSDENAEMLRYLAELGIRPGVQVTVTDRAPFDGPITVKIGRTTKQIGAALAERISVEME